MMAEKHPDELELLSYVEEELSADDRQEVVEHLVACRSCSEHVRRLEAGRAVLRSAPLLEFPEARRRELLASLPEHPDRWRPFRPLKRVLVVAAPVAAAAALVGVLVLAGPLGDGGGDDQAAVEAGEAAETAMELREDEQAGGAEDAAPESAQAGEFLRNVQGPAEEVVRLLRAEGFEATVAPDGTVLAEGVIQEVRAALAGRPAGDVAVYVR